jgi:hypothetical protein
MELESGKCPMIEKKEKSKYGNSSKTELPFMGKVFEKDPQNKSISGGC